MYALKITCMEAGCTKLVWGNEGDCHWCLTIRCKTHRKQPYHVCDGLPYEELRALCNPSHARKWNDLLGGLDPYIIADQLACFRSGHTCSVDIPANKEAVYKADMYTSCNFHFFVRFDDGVRWLVRTRASWHDRPPSGLQDRVTISEVETMNAMYRHGLLVPAAYLSVKDPDRTVRRNPDYFFTDFCEGSPWCETINPVVRGEKTLQQVMTFIEDYAQYQIQNSTLTFPCIGSLYPSTIGDRSEVGPLIDNGYFNRPQEPFFLGPFPTMRVRYLAQIDLVLDLIEDGLYDEQPVSAFLMHLWARKLVEGEEKLAVEEEHHYIKHADDKMDQFLTNDHEHIVAIIDWEWAFVTTKAHAFAAPIGFYDNDQYQEGKNHLTLEEQLLVMAYDRLGFPDLADCVKNGRIYQRLGDVIGETGVEVAQLNALNEVTTVGRGVTPSETIEDWCERTKVALKDDERLQRFLHSNTALDAEVDISKKGEEVEAAFASMKIATTPS